MEGVAREFLYDFDKSSELNIKANLLKRYSEDREGSFASRMVVNGIFLTFVEEAWKNYESALDALNDLLASSKKEPIPEEVLVNLDSFRLKPYFQDCFSFERFELHQKNEHNLREMVIEGQFFARTLTINYRHFLFDIVAMNPPGRHRHQRRR
jgi:FPC/CPF motif-containing protein YcgG